LLAHRRQLTLPAQFRPSAIAIDAAAQSHMTVAVGTGKSCVNLQLVHAAAEQIAPVTFQVVVVFVVLPKIRFGQINLFFMLYFYRLCRKKSLLFRLKDSAMIRFIVISKRSEKS